MLWESILPEAITHHFEIFRVKGRVTFVDGSLKLIQGVRDVFEIVDHAESAAGVSTTAIANGIGKLVLIGRGLDSDFPASLELLLGWPGTDWNLTTNPREDT